MIRTTASSARVSAGELDSILVPTHWKKDGSLPGIIACHGAGATGQSPVNVTLSGSYRLHRLLGKYYPIIATDLGGPQTWGNPTAQARVATCKTYLQTTMGAKTGPVILVGISMGNLTALNYARNNLSSVIGTSIDI